jgi:hypothetical protein
MAGDIVNQFDATLTLADREIDPGIFEHPSRIIVLEDGRLGGEQGRVEPDRLRQIVNRHVDMQGASSSSAEELLMPSASIYRQMGGGHAQCDVVDWGLTDAVHAHGTSPWP